MTTQDPSNPSNPDEPKVLDCFAQHALVIEELNYIEREEAPALEKLRKTFKYVPPKPEDEYND
jgi:hypothetical protein